MKKYYVYLAISLLIICGLGCGKTSDNTIYQKLCSAICDFQVRCNSKDRTVCQTDCLSRPYGIYVTPYIESMTTCFSSLLCSSNDDVCITNALSVVAPNCITSDPYTTCMNKKTVCDNEGNGFMDDYCPTGCVLMPAAKTSYLTCFTQTCTQVPTCLRQVTGVN